MADEIEVKGLKEVQKALYAYSQKLGDKVVIGALKIGATVIKKEIERRAPVYKGSPRAYVKPGTLKRGFKISKSRIYNGRGGTGTIGVYLTLKKGKGRHDPKDPFYGKFIEAGFRNKQGIRFVEDAFLTRRDESVRVIVAAADSAADLLTKKVGL
jgi:HK97 gp10 family phage protein